jgi:hypothetical protein
MEARPRRSLREGSGRVGGDGSLEIGCALRDGAFEVDGDDSLDRSDGEQHALIFFVVRLLRQLQNMASPPAIVYEEYERAILQQ